MKINAPTAIELLYGKSEYAMILVAVMARKEGQVAAPADCEAARIFDAAQVVFKIVAQGYASLGEDRKVTLTDKGNEIAYLLKEDEKDAD